MLYEQRSDWARLRKELRDGGTVRARYQGMVTRYDCLGHICFDDICAGHDSVGYDWTGRGATAVWRAERRVEVQDFEDWLIRRCDADRAEREMWPPGWLVRAPGMWHARVMSAAAAGMPEPYAGWVADERVLTFSYQESQAVWPVIPSHDLPGCEPAPGIGPLIRAAKKLRPHQIISFIEAVLIDWGGDYEESTIRIALDLPVDKARGFGFITSEEEQQARAQARAGTLQAMDDIIDKLPEDHHHLRPQLEQARNDARSFGRVAHRIRINGRPVKFRVTRATWPWPGGSVVDELLAGARANLVEWLATQAYRTSTLLLDQSMEEAWRRAFNRSGHRV